MYVVIIVDIYANSIMTRICSYTITFTLHGRESLNPKTQCTTSAVFHRMEEISCTMLTASMKHGLEVLDRKMKVAMYVCIYVFLYS